MTTTHDMALLLQGAQQGDAEAFCQLATEHETRLYQQALTLCGHFHLAEDLVAETMVEAWRSIGRFNGRCRFSTWLYAILMHRYQKLLRRNRSRPVLLSSLPGPEADEPVAVLARLPDPQPTASDNLLQSESASRLQTALAGLPELHQAVVRLRFFDGASLEEIAVALGVPTGTVKSRLHHALARLREMPEVLNLEGGGGDK